MSDAVIDGLSIISVWPDRDSSSGPLQLLDAIKQPEFIYFQNINLVEAMSLTDNVGI